MAKIWNLFFIIAVSLKIQTSFAQLDADPFSAVEKEHLEIDHEHLSEEEHLHSLEDNTESEVEDFDLDLMFGLRGCQKANSSQIAVVNQGNSLQNNFLDECERVTGNKKLCQEVRRPNPSSQSTFYCTYSPNQPHQLIHPSTSTWKFAFKAIELIDRLKTKGICVSQIYNWWRPEPYNKNVGGAAGRHPFGTSIDVRFCSKTDAIKAFDTLCQYRKKGEVRALGYYGSTGLHIGVGDTSANTWGRNCN
jgi:hypothetical protein